MRNKMKYKLSVVFLIFCVFNSCSENTLKAESISICNWNVQTFFDAHKTGTEYSEFLKNENWNSTAYEARLKRLCNCIKLLDADVFVLEEIENEGILYDIANALAGYSWNQKKNWTYACFAKCKDQAIGCAVLSRFELKNFSVHELYVQTEKEAQPMLRPIIKVTVCKGQKDLELFVNHWKSKSGGEEETQVWRNWQETQLMSLLEQTCSPFLCSGDFNQKTEEFSYLTDFTFSPWIIDNDIYRSQGTYYYNGAFEQIDHFFADKNLQITQFEPATNGPWCNENNIPISFKIYSGSGYSDHLPIKCKVDF